MSKQGEEYFQFHRQEMVRFLPASYSHVLEVGCGEGNFRQNLMLQHEYWGVEQSPIAVEKASKVLDTVIVGNYERVSDQIPDHYFDLIICNDVIEHMEHHCDFLFNIKQKLAPNGSLVLSIPNVRCISNLIELLFKKDWRYRDAGILDSTHLRFFTKKSLARTLQETGWQINQLAGINRYGSHRIGHKLAFSYLAQCIFGADSAYLQFGANLTLPRTIS